MVDKPVTFALFEGNFSPQGLVFRGNAGVNTFVQITGYSIFSQSIAFIRLSKPGFDAAGLQGQDCQQNKQNE